MVRTWDSSVNPLQPMRHTLIEMRIIFSALECLIPHCIQRSCIYNEVVHSLHCCWYFDIFSAMCSRRYSLYWSASVGVCVITAVVIYTTVRQLFLTLFVYRDTDKKSRYILSQARTDTSASHLTTQGCLVGATEGKVKNTSYKYSPCFVHKYNEN
jgi:hypothetical protein